MIGHEIAARNACFGADRRLPRRLWDGKQAGRTPVAWHIDRHHSGSPYHIHFSPYRIHFGYHDNQF